MDFAKLKSDPIREQEGAWIELGDGAAILVARMGNPAYEKCLRRLRRPLQSAIRAKTVTDDQILKIVIRASAEFILLDWRGMFEDGKPLAYSVDVAERILTEVKDFREMVYGFAADAEIYRQEETEEDAKKS